MNRFTAVLVLCVVGGNLPTQGQIISQNIVGPIYLASLYNVKCDETGGTGTDDTAALLALVNTVHNNGGGTIVLPPTGHWCKISGSLDYMGNGWWAEVNLVGCGMYGSQSSSSPATPPCGLDLRLDDSTAKIRLITQGQTIFRDLAIVDNNVSDCSDPTNGSPFFLITETVVHFQNVSISGAKSKLNACNDAFILGNKAATDCSGSGLITCFKGYGSTFQNIYAAQVRRIALFNTAANGTDWDYVLADSTNGNKISGVLGSAFEFNSPNTPGNGGEPYGNVFKNLAIEQGDTSQQNYQYALDVIQKAGPNSVFGITCSDVPVGANKACVHIGSSDVSPQMVLGCDTNSTPSFPGCVAMDGIGSYPDIVGDLYNGNPAFFARNYYGGNLGSTSHPFNNLNLAVNLSLAGGGSISGTEGVPSPQCGANADFLWADSTALRWKMCNHNGSAVQVVGSGADINASDQVTATHLSSPLPNSQGGTGLNTGASTGVAQVSSGTWSISTALANGTTAFTQTAGDNSTKVATTAYSDAGRPVMIYFFSATGTTGATFFSVGTNDTTESNVEYPMDQLGTITSMTCRTVNVQGAPGRTATLTLDKGGIGCNLTVSWSNINGVQTDGAHNCSYSAGNLLDMSLTVSGGTPNATQYMCTLTGHR